MDFFKFNAHTKMYSFFELSFFVNRVDTSYYISPFLFRRPVITKKPVFLLFLLILFLTKIAYVCSILLYFLKLFPFFQSTRTQEYIMLHSYVYILSLKKNTQSYIFFSGRLFYHRHHFSVPHIYNHFSIFIFIFKYII